MSKNRGLSTQSGKTKHWSSPKTNGTENKQGQYFALPSRESKPKTNEITTPEMRVSWNKAPTPPLIDLGAISAKYIGHTTVLAPLLIPETDFMVQKMKCYSH